VGANGDVFLIGGGYIPPDEDAFVHCADVWKMDVRKEKWVEQECGGPMFIARRGHSAVVYKDRHIIVFGGASGSDFFADPNAAPGLAFIHSTIPRNDVMVLDVATMKWSDPFESRGRPRLQPHPRRGHCATVHGDRMIVVGGDIQTGQDEEVELNSLALIWSLDLTTWEWSCVTGHGSVPYGLSLCCHERVGPTYWVFFGGKPRTVCSVQWAVCSVQCAV
jgi:hypothetical protein